MQKTIQEILISQYNVPTTDFIDSQHSDLWVNVSPQATEFLTTYYPTQKNKYTIFTDQLTNKRVYDIAFGKYETIETSI